MHFKTEDFTNKSIAKDKSKRQYRNNDGKYIQRLKPGSVSSIFGEETSVAPLPASFDHQGEQSQAEPGKLTYASLLQEQDIKLPEGVAKVTLQSEICYFGVSAKENGEGLTVDFSLHIKKDLTFRMFLKDQKVSAHIVTEITDGLKLISTMEVEAIKY